MADKTVLLRNALSGFQPSYIPVKLEIEKEIGIFTEKLEEMSNSIEKFDHNNKETEYKNIYTRLEHVSGRLKRILAEEGDRYIIVNKHRPRN